MCGTVSFKKGESFFRANKVTIDHYSQDLCAAKVTGTEDFQVTIEQKSNGGFSSKCSCPSLASFQKDCQHIAAVLLAIYHYDMSKKNSAISGEYQLGATNNQGLSDGLLTLFNQPSTRSSGHQLHLENRQVIDAVFTCKLVQIGNGHNLLGIEVKIGPAEVPNIRQFLERLKEGMPSILSSSFTYDLNTHCFVTESDAVIQQLIQVNYDEKTNMDKVTESRATISDRILLIPPSSWKMLVPLLKSAKVVRLEHDGQTFDSLELTEEGLPLQFHFLETKSHGYQLKIDGLDRMVVLGDYQSVLYDGKIVRMQAHNSKRLAELKRMLAGQATNLIPIAPEQVDLYLEKVVPGLKQLGDVKIARGLNKRYAKTPLVAKLYLDRVNNRLLAGLEFHYQHIVINPLENREVKLDSLILRDVDKEEEILKLMEDSLFAKTESGYFLHNEELEYQFLYHVVPKLNKLVQIYTTTAIRNRIVKENARPKIRVRVQKERTNWLEFKFEVAGIPEDQIRDLLEALEEKRKYYRLRNGALLSLETSEFEEVNQFLHALPVQNKGLENGLDLPMAQSLQLLDSIEDTGTLMVEKSFRQFLENIQNPGSKEFEVPTEVASILRDYQKQGYYWMKTLASFSFGGILADDMGLGKTLQSITFILSELPDIRKKKLPVLIVCPSSVTYNWLSEISKFAPVLQAIVLDGNQIQRSSLQKDVTDIDIVITSYPLLRSDINWYEKQTFHTVFFDEAQAFKNPITQTARAVKRIQSDHRFALTGTPVENSLEELWSIFHVVFPELFQGLKDYSNLPKKTIARRVRPFLLRRLKRDVLLELPRKTESQQSTELLPEQKNLYAAYLAKLRHDTWKHLDKETLGKNRIRILAGLTRLRQICCHPSLFVDGYKGSSAKFEQLLQIIEESKLSGRRVLIFSQFTKMLDLIGRELAVKGIPFFYLDGQTPPEERVATCNRFNVGERDLFLISMKAGGTGLNLTGADTVIMYDTWWNPAVEEQAADRAYRIGQTNKVKVIKLVARGTIEEKMNELQDKKRHLIEEIIDSKEKKSVSVLTEEDIREILML
ncbi:DEAD/DEAH box helicase [Aquibacillus saliphilus]|uniref:DEAD/DEAH box helicase n=1 Tax=Aquibacillus saliphilus TaxID=1909422 RepID=UPI001CF07E79|nr:DEAD/DEAH box helicase [Aquibacillus saliphilus]